MRFSTIRAHHIMGGLSVLVGVSFLLERYQLVSRALQAAFEMLSWVPALTGQQAWGICFIVGGALILVPWHVYLRVVALILGAGSWAVFSTGPLYEAFLGPNKDETGAFAGLMALAVVTTFILASRRVAQDFKRSH